MSTHDKTSDAPKTTEVDIKSIMSTSVKQSDLLKLDSKVLTDEEITTILKKELSSLAKMKTKTSKEVLYPFFEAGENKEHDKVFINSSLLEAEDSPLIWAILHLCQTFSVIVNSFTDEKHYKQSTPHEQVAYGVLIGVQDTKPTGLGKKKSGIELGRAMIFGLRVMEEFRAHNVMSALIKNHPFFGNKPPGKNEKDPEAFYANTMIPAIYEDQGIGNALYKILLKLIRKLRLSNFEDVDYLNTVFKYHKKFDDIVTSHYTPIIAQRGERKGDIIGYKKALKPRKSPLFTDGEMLIIDEFLSPVWSSLDNLKRNYFNEVQSSTGAYLVVNQAVAAIIASRNEILQKFAKATKKRLEEIRSLTKEEKLRKGKVTRDQLTSLLIARDKKVVKKFIRELIMICGERFNYLKALYCEKHKIMESRFDDFVTKAMLMSYEKDIGTVINPEDIPEVPEAISAEQLNFKHGCQTMRAISQNMNRSKMISNRITWEMKEWAVQQCDQLLPVVRAIVGVKTSDIPNEVWSEVVKYTFIPDFISKDDFINIQVGLSNILSRKMIEEFSKREKTTPGDSDWKVFRHNLKKLTKFISKNVNFSTSIYE